MDNNQKDNFVEMKNKILAFLFSYSLIFSQPSLIWVKEYDNGFNDYAQAVATDANGNIIVTGTSYNGTDFDCFTIKYNPLGETLWTRRFDTGASDVARDVAMDSDGDIILAGSSCIDSIHDYLIVKYDNSGNLIWMRRYQTGLDNFSMGVAVDAFQNIVITGYSYNGNDYDYLTIKYSPFGDTIWSRRFDGGVNDIGVDVGIDPNGCIIVTGSSCDTATSLFSPLTIKYNQDGDSIWAERFIYSGPGGSIYSYSVATDKDSNIVMTCVNEYGSGSQYILLIKYTPTGDTIWTLIFKQSWYFYLFTPRDIIVDTANNIFVTGEQKWDQYRSYNFQTYKFSPDGDSLWIVDYQFGLTDPDEFGCGVAVDLSGNIYVTGYYDNGNDYDYLTLKYTEQASLAENNKERKLKAEGIKLEICPSMVTHNAQFKYTIPEKQRIRLNLYDIVGRKFATLTKGIVEPGIYSYNFDSGNLSSGIYFLILEGEKATKTQKVIITR